MPLCVLDLRILIKTFCTAGFGYGSGVGDPGQLHVESVPAVSSPLVSWTRSLKPSLSRSYSYPTAASGAEAAASVADERKWRHIVSNGQILVVEGLRIEREQERVRTMLTLEDYSEMTSLFNCSSDLRNLLPPGCPIQINEVINLDIEQFNELVARLNMTEEHVSQLRDVRRKGKNRYAIFCVRITQSDTLKNIHDRDAAKKSREKTLSHINSLHNRRDDLAEKVASLREQVLTRRRENSAGIAELGFELTQENLQRRDQDWARTLALIRVLERRAAEEAARKNGGGAGERAGPSNGVAAVEGSGAAMAEEDRHRDTPDSSSSGGERRARETQNRRLDPA